MIDHKTLTHWPRQLARKAKEKHFDLYKIDGSVYQAILFVRCPEGHEFQINYRIWQAMRTNAMRCGVCDGWRYQHTKARGEGMCNKGELRSVYHLSASQIAALGAPDRIVRDNGIGHYYRIERVLEVKEGLDETD